MQNKKEYWINKEKRAEVAKEHTRDMESKYSSEIADCVRKTKIYNQPLSSTGESTGSARIGIQDIDTVGAILQYSNGEKKVAALNFASYKNPGGMFLRGSKAQEECLCHESFLYNVLREFEDSYYVKNRRDKNKALYRNRALYSPDIVFERGNKKRSCDIITCAAPNKSTAQKYCNVSDEENLAALKSRIEFVLEVARNNSVKILILGAFGCGVFGQDAKEVAEVTCGLIREKYQDFDRVIFAIPNSKNGNFEAFGKAIFGETFKDAE